MPGKPVFGPISNEELSGEDGNKELEALNLIYKNDVKIPREEGVQMGVDRKDI